jgi:hypothetical protein
MQPCDCLAVWLGALTNPVKEDDMKRNWNAALQSLVLVRMGQELGTDSDLAQAVAHSIDFVLGTLARFLG